jgi:DnaJ-class molecular chaperone
MNKKKLDQIRNTIFSARNELRKIEILIENDVPRNGVCEKCNGFGDVINKGGDVATCPQCKGYGR